MEELSFDQLLFLRNTMHPNEYTITRVGLLPILLRDVDNKGMEEYYILGIDRGCGLLSDFGGHCNLINIEIPINCLYRELEEEMGVYLSRYFKSKIVDDRVKNMSRIFVIKNDEDMSMKIQIFLKFQDDQVVIDDLLDSFEPNDEIKSIGSVELFMNNLLDEK